MAAWSTTNHVSPGGVIEASWLYTVAFRYIIATSFNKIDIYVSVLPLRRDGDGRRRAREGEGEGEDEGDGEGEREKTERDATTSSCGCPRRWI